MRGGGFLYSRHRGWGFIGPLPTDLQKPPPQNNRAGELGPLPSQGVLLTQYTVFHNILCHYALRVKNTFFGGGMNFGFKFKVHVTVDSFIT